MATTPPSPVSSWTMDGPAASDGAHPAPVLVWPSSTKSLTVHDPCRGGALHLKLAQENETLQIWLEEAASKRQFYASLTNEECKAIVKDMLDPSNLLEMLHEALSTSSEAGEGLSVSFEWLVGSVILILHFLPNKWMAKPFKFPLAEREVSHVDRLERRIDDVETALKNKAPKEELEAQILAHTVELKAELTAMVEDQAQTTETRTADHVKAELTTQIQSRVDDLKAELTAEIQNQIQAERMRRQEDQARQAEEAKHAELNSWVLHVSNPYQGGEGACGHNAMSGNHFLIQEVDYATKKAGVATHNSQQGIIQATFPKPVHVSAVKIAHLPPYCNSGISNNNDSAISTQPPHTGEWEVLRSNIPGATKEEVFPINKTILALRITGTLLGISKLIFS